MNPMQLLQLMGQVQSSNNPMALIQNMFGSNPMMQRALEMGRGKSVSDLQQTVRNLASQQGIDSNQLNQFLSKFGLKL